MNKLEKLSDILVNYSLQVKKDENVLITCDTFDAMELIELLIEKIYNNDGNVNVEFTNSKIRKLILQHTSDSKVDLIEKKNRFNVMNYDSFIHIRYNSNDYENSNIDNEIINKIAKKTQRTNMIRVNERKWVLLEYPSNLDAYKAKMGTKEYFDYAINSMIYDYSKMKSLILPLKNLMENTNNVRIVGNETDISFSIKGMPVIPCVGEKNIPDGEIYTCPLKKSVNGTIKYNTPSPYRGNIYGGVKLTFKNGKIIKAECDNKNNIDALNEIFDTDSGARFIGEFSLGINPLIKRPMCNILYDEKIDGSIHFTPGAAYKDCYNGNNSSIHWDMVLIQTKEYGGGEIYFDDVLIRKDGKFVLDSLKHLNNN